MVQWYFNLCVVDFTKAAKKREIAPSDLLAGIRYISSDPVAVRKPQ